VVFITSALIILGKSPGFSSVFVLSIVRRNSGKAVEEKMEKRDEWEAWAV